MANALHPDLMTPAERLDEIADILSAGILRVRARLRAPRGSTAEQVRVAFLPLADGRIRTPGTQSGQNCGVERVPINKPMPLTL
jgi:hypothetical protein